MAAASFYQLVVLYGQAERPPGYFQFTFIFDLYKPAAGDPAERAGRIKVEIYIHTIFSIVLRLTIVQEPAAITYGGHSDDEPLVFGAHIWHNKSNLCCQSYYLSEPSARRCSVVL